ncbi:NUDIX hydrolase domain-like protein [Zychaea mexicana]|uniref:NUDIX hydrolase domain-like protein n=1 Tax=Zychaea mexicana TaxID=64656 RepID=UPI0022FDD9E0|nr:NUDIX hydrolase domain-like protein [Zychaea mexicana]KAI9488933.1 NUDIX hydrolase domain-like protein [Zychaea mexicana]
MCVTFTLFMRYQADKSMKSELARITPHAYIYYFSFPLYIIMSSSNVFEAAAQGDLEYLQQNRGNVGVKNERGWTALHFAARFGQADIVEFLVKQPGCDLSATNSEGKTAAQVAEFWGFDAIAKLLAPSQGAREEQEQNEEQAIIKGSPFPPNRNNFFAGSPLNRFSWYRNDKNILRRLARSPRSKYLLLNGLDPLFETNAGLYLAKYDQVASLVDKAVPGDDGVKPDSDVMLVFLGIDEKEAAAEDGQAYWALDLTPKGPHKQELKKLVEGFKAQNLEFSPALPRAFSIDEEAASILAQARAMLDWNTRNLYCPACGRKTFSDEAGHKRRCPSSEHDPCISQKGVHNFAYPRTDPVIIVGIVHPTEDKLLLGRQKRWPGRMHSCIAGFVEAGESIEEAVRREAYEEAGVKVNRVLYHSSQPWPFPNSLMFGFIAEAVTTDIKLEDKELEAAVWFTRAEVLAAINQEPGAKFTMPPGTAIAHQLIKTWATDREWRAKKSNAKM